MKAPTPDGLFRLESDTSREGVGGTLLQKQGDEWVVIGYHSKRLPNQQRILAKRASSFNNTIKLVNENVQITHDQLITLEKQNSDDGKSYNPRIERLLTAD